MNKFEKNVSQILFGIISLIALLSGFVFRANFPGVAAQANNVQINGTVDSQVIEGSDDGEEEVTTGTVILTSSDLELVNETDTKVDQLVGIRFVNIDIPYGATISNAYMLFTVDEVTDMETSVTIHGEASDNATTFEAIPGNISQRALTNAATDWLSIPAWTTVGELKQTPDLSSVVQEIVNRPGWNNHQAMAFVISGSGRRTAIAYNGLKASAPRLHIEWQLQPTPTATLSPTASPTEVATETATVTATPPVPSTATPTLEATPIAEIAPQCNRTGGATRSLWYGLPGSLVTDLKKQALYPANPDRTEILNKLDSSRNMDDNFGELIRGYLCPAQSGQYTFWIAGDDQSEFWLSSDNRPENSQRTAFVPSWSNYQEWEKEPEQRSVEITLVANQAYFFAVMHKESVSDDHVSIAWQGPNMAQQVVSGRYIAPYADNLPLTENHIFLPLINR